MKLLTAEIRKALPAIGATDGMGMEAPVVVKFFNPTGSATWYITEGSEITLPDGTKDWDLFGLCDLYGDGGELGYVRLSELEGLRLPYGLRIERDKYFEIRKHTLAQCRVRRP